MVERKNHPPFNHNDDEREPEFVNGDFLTLKRLIMYRLDQSDAQRAELAAKVESLTVEVRTNNAEHKLAYGLLKAKVTGISVISAIASGAATGALTAFEYLKRWRP